MSENWKRHGSYWQRNGPLYTLVALVVIYAAIVVRTAWLSDDSYISFRVISNLVNGYGLRWNVAERVQVYTHPLWLFLLASFHLVTREMYFTPILMSIAISVAAVALLAFGVAQTRENGAFAVLLLVFSCAYVDYSTSGLENPLTHLLVVLFAVVYFRGRFTGSRCLMLGAIASLGMLNRMDLALVFGPALGYALLQARNKRAMALMALGFTPFLGWELFSLLYYGFPFPNTYYAKLGKGISGWTLARSGFLFLWDSLRNDPVTLPGCAAGILAPLLLRDWSRAVFAAGAALYLGYVVKIGGDWMSGRFLDVSLLVAALVIAGLTAKTRHSVWVAGLLGVVTLGLLARYPTIFSGENCAAKSLAAEVQQDFQQNSIGSARVHDYGQTGLLVALHGTSMPDSPDREKGLAMAARNDTPFQMITNGGMLPFFAGPSTYFMDLWCLGDPFRARMPCSTTTKIAAGHLARPVPTGYVETLSSGENKLADPRLAEYYDHLRLIIRGRLFDPVRLKTILRMNLGLYDELLEEKTDSDR